MAVREIELAWAAGFFDGEGSIGTYRDNRHRGRIAIQMCVAQSGHETEPPASLIRFRDAVGCGTVARRRDTGGRLGRKPMWYWRSGTVDETRQAVNLLVPYLTEKIDQVAAAMSLRLEWQGHQEDRARFCKRGHEFTPDNIYTYENRPTPARLCRTCNRENTRLARARRRAQAQLAAAEGLGG